MPTRYALVVEYDGRPFVGWQRQDTGPSVQAALEDAMQGFCGETTRVQGSGRTDTGVHALGQVAHVDLDKAPDSDTLAAALNAHLRPQPIAVLRAAPAPEDFSARFSAIRRAYRYVIVNRRAPLTLEAGRAWQIGPALDDRAMAAAARHLLGHHDFTSFRASQCQADSPRKTLDQITVTREAERITVTVAARSFLHHMVRNIVGSLVLVGKGKWQPDDIAAALAAQDRRAAGPTAPPDGLYLIGVAFPAPHEKLGSMSPT